MNGAKQGSVGVVLVNWNAADLTVACIESLLKGSAGPDHIVVVDNASADRSVDIIMDRFPSVILVRNDRNAGFAAANNTGIGILLNHAVEFVWILNNDTRVEEDCLATLLRMARGHPAVAAFSGKIFLDPSNGQIWYGGARRHPVHRAPKHILTDELDATAKDGIVPVEFLSGCCIFARAATLRRYGGFLPEYVAYSEDSEWCWRVRDGGGLLGYVPGARIWHKVSASVKMNARSHNSADRIPGYCLRLMIRNHLWTVRAREGRFMRRWIGLATSLLLQLRNMVAYWASRRSDLARDTATGIADGLIRPVPRQPLFPCQL